MHDNARSPRPGSGRHPDLALDMLRTVDACRALQGAALAAGGPGVIGLVAGVAEYVASARGGTAEQVVAAALGAVPSLSSAEVSASVSRSWSSVEVAPGMDSLIGELRSEGVDGEGLCWAMVSLESTQHTKLVWQRANRLARTFPDRRPDDLLGFGWRGLRAALRKYDPSRFAFSTYACPRIDGAIRDGVRSENPVPKRLTTEVRKVSGLEHELTAELGRVPSLREVVEHLGGDSDYCQLMARCRGEASLDELLDPLKDRSDTPGWVAAGDEFDPESRALDSLRNRDIRGALGSLHPDDAAAVRLLVLEEMTISRACELTGATSRQIRQRRDRGLQQLGALLSAWAPA